MLPTLAAAQQTVPNPPAPAPSPSPSKQLTARQRVSWVIDGSTSLPALGVNAAGAALSTYGNWPEEWGRGLKGFGRRFADAEAYDGIADAIEAGVGAFWDEDPRYQRLGRQSTWRRVRYAVTATFLTPRRDGRLAPAWARFTAIAATSRIENTWLPPSVKTPGATAWRVGGDLLGRALSNVWDEFWPDLRQRLPWPAP